MPNKFEDLNVWKESMNLVVSIYKEINNFKDYGLKDQMRRASVSIPSNISEGHDRSSNKDFARFLYIARGSCAELRSQLYISIKLDFISKEKGMDLVDKTKKISSMLFKLIKSVKD